MILEVCQTLESSDFKAVADLAAQEKSINKKRKFENSKNLNETYQVPVA